MRWKYNLIQCGKLHQNHTIRAWSEFNGVSSGVILESICLHNKDTGVNEPIFVQAVTGNLVAVFILAGCRIFMTSCRVEPARKKSGIPLMW